MTGAVEVRLRRGVAPTPMQRSLIASQRRHPTEPLQNMALVSHLGAPIDAERFAASKTALGEDYRIDRITPQESPLNRYSPLV